MESIEDLGFVKYTTRGRVEVFWLSLVDDPTGEGDDITGKIRDRKYDPSKKFISVGGYKYSRIHDIFVGKSLGYELGVESARISRVSDLKGADRLDRESSTCHIGELVRIVRMKELFVVGSRDKFIEIIDIGTVFSSFFVVVRLELDSGFFGEHLYRLSELDLFDLREKLDRTSSFMTRKTVGDIFGRRDHERWSFLTMKRTTRLVVGSGFLHLDIATDEIYDVDLGVDLSRNRHGESIWDMDERARGKMGGYREENF